MGWYQRLVDKVGGILFYTILGFLIVFSPLIHFVVFVLEAPSVVIHNSVSSPDGKLVAVIFETQGDATTSLNTQVSIASTRSSFSRDRNPPFLWVHGQHDLLVQWHGDKTIGITLPEGEKTDKRDVNTSGVTVEYK